ncbi:MAG: HEAT repeat domain-containing protein, partial [Myxococcota bacterium]
PHRKAFLALVVALMALVEVVSPGAAQDREALARVLNSGRDFRVRVQAAFALGNTRDAAAVPALTRALRDSNPAVRAAAATALGRIGSDRAEPALRRAARDRSAAVRMQAERSLRNLAERRAASAPQGQRRTPGSLAPAINIIPSEGHIPWPRIRYVVIVGSMRDASNFRSASLEEPLRNEVTRQLRVLRGVAVMPSEDAVDARARREIRRRRLPQFVVDGRLNSVRPSRQGRDVSVRCEVSLMLLDGEQRSIRGEMRGAATGSAPRQRARAQQERALAEQALSAAVRSALSNAQRAIARAANR